MSDGRWLRLQSKASAAGPKAESKSQTVKKQQQVDAKLSTAAPTIQTKTHPIYDAGSAAKNAGSKNVGTMSDSKKNGENESEIPLMTIRKITSQLL